MNSNLSENERAEIGLLLEMERWERVVSTLQPVNTPAILSHWRPLVFLWDKLSSEQRGTISKLDQEPGSSIPAPVPIEPDVEMEPGVLTPATTATATPAATGQSSSGLISGFDAHFHPDRLNASASGSQDARCVMVPGREPDHPLPITGGVLNYSSPVQV